MRDLLDVAYLIPMLPSVNVIAMRLNKRTRPKLKKTPAISH